MWALSMAVLVTYLSVGASPCIGASGEKPGHAPHAESIASSHADCEARGLKGPIAHHRGAVAVSELQARCPCGCEDGQAAANSFARLGYGTLVDVIGPASIDSYRDVAAKITEDSQAEPQPVDHVPIFS
jgi:hypothetical protein